MRSANIQNNFCMNPDKSGTGSYNCKAVVFSMHSEKVSAGWTGHFFGFDKHCLFQKAMCSLVLTPYPRINVSSVFSSAHVL